MRGPIANMAKMYLAQSFDKSRGLHLDSLHSVYTTYSDMFISNDPHFLSLNKLYEDDFNLMKIIDVKDLDFGSIQLEINR